MREKEPFLVSLLVRPSSEDITKQTLKDAGVTLSPNSAPLTRIQFRGKIHAGTLYETLTTFDKALELGEALPKILISSTRLSATTEHTVDGSTISRN